MSDFIKIQNTAVRMESIIRMFVEGNKLIVKTSSVDLDNGSYYEIDSPFKYKTNKQAQDALTAFVQGSKLI